MGVTLLICSHNGAARLPATLSHLAAQQMPAGLPWEVLLVSNASTDDTLAAGPRLWAELGAPASLRVLDEPRPGKENALSRGFDEARYEAIVVVDDDNWLGPLYAARAAAILANHPQIGVLGGYAEAAFETEPPPWFGQFQAFFAVGPQAERSGALRQPEAYIYGAGSVLRGSAWRYLRRQGFVFTTSTRRGATLVSGEDLELGDVLRLAGYLLWYDPELGLKHFMPPTRLTADYLRRLVAGSAASSLTSMVYYYLHREPELTAAEFRRHFRRGLLWLLRQLLASPARLVAYHRFGPDPAHPETLDILRLLERLRAGWHGREQASRIFDHAKALQQRFRQNPVLGLGQHE